ASSSRHLAPRPPAAPPARVRAGAAARAAVLQDPHRQRGRGAGGHHVRQHAHRAVRPRPSGGLHPGRGGAAGGGRHSGHGAGERRHPQDGPAAAGRAGARGGAGAAGRPGRARAAVPRGGPRAGPADAHLQRHARRGRRVPGAGARGGVAGPERRGRGAEADFARASRRDGAAAGGPAHPHSRGEGRGRSTGGRRPARGHAPGDRAGAGRGPAVRARPSPTRAGRVGPGARHRIAPAFAARDQRDGAGAGRRSVGGRRPFRRGRSGRL
ncbi:MAG: hypothetical protein AVDCRST_MAG89-2253, partial [uncultured Gemmatimonadetes bacterium]